MNRTIRSGTREVIYKVFLRCLAEFQAGKLLTDLEDVYKRTADMTGKSESTVRRIADEGSKTMYSNIDELIIRVGGDSSSESESDSEYEDFSSNLPSTSREDSIQDIEENMSGVEYIDFDLLDEEDTPE